MLLSGKLTVDVDSDNRLIVKKRQHSNYNARNWLADSN